MGNNGTNNVSLYFRDTKLKAYNDSYRGASRTLRQLKNWNPPLHSPTGALTEPIRHNLAARSRDMVKNHPLGAAIVNRPGTHVVGTGLKLKAKPNYQILGIKREEAEELAKQYEAEFNLYAESEEIDLRRTSNFYELQLIALTSAYASGDCFALTPNVERPGSLYSTKLQLIEGDRISNPDYELNTEKLRDGIELDNHGAPRFYHVRQAHPNDLLWDSLKSQQWKKIRVFGTNLGIRRAFHVFTKPRPGSVRGAPLMAPVIEFIQMATQHSRAEVTAALNQAIYTVFWKSPSGRSPVEVLNTRGDDEIDRNMPELGSGTMASIFDDEDVIFPQATHPHKDFGPFQDAIMKYVGAAIGIPVEELLLKYEASYSAARAAMLRAYAWYLGQRAWLGQRLCTPFYKVWFFEAIARGRIQAPGFYDDAYKRLAYMQCAWMGPAQGNVDELKEAKADDVELKSATTTRQRIAAKKGLDFWGDIFPELERENKALESIGIYTREESQTNATT